MARSFRERAALSSTQTPRRALAETESKFRTEPKERNGPAWAGALAGCGLRGESAGSDQYVRFAKGSVVVKAPALEGLVEKTLIDDAFEPILTIAPYRLPATK